MKGRLLSVARSIENSWDAFFFTPQPATPIALYRILYGLIIIADLVLLHGDWLTWFGANGFVRLETLRQLSPGINISLLKIIPQGDAWIEGFFWVTMLFAVCLTVGFKSRFSSVAVFICFSSMYRRNSFILHSGDTLLRACGFFLMLAPTDAAISVDRLLRIWRGKEGNEQPLCSPWAQRMIQIQTSMVYLSTFAWKTVGADWRNGTAMYYTSRLLEFQRFPMPALENGLAVKLATWFALAAEGTIGALVWVRKIRYWILLLGVCLHLGIEYSMNIPLFQWITLAAYVTFIDPADLTRAWAWVQRHLAGRLGDPADVIYDTSCVRTIRQAGVLRALDVFGQLNFVDVHSSAVRSAWPALLEGGVQTRLLVGIRGSLYEGFSSLLAIARLVPMLWPLTPLSFLSGPRKLSLAVAKATK